MAKPTTIKIRLNSSAGTGHFYVTKKNAFSAAFCVFGTDLELDSAEG